MKKMLYGHGDRPVPKSLGRDKYHPGKKSEVLKRGAEKKTNKHKQLLGIVPGMGGGQICLCVAFFLDKKGNT